MVWHVSTTVSVTQLLTGESSQNVLDAIMIGRCQGDDTSASGETGNLLFSKDAYSPSTYRVPHPLPSQIFLFAMASSSLAIPSARSTIEENKLVGCEHFLHFNPYSIRGRAKYHSETFAYPVKQDENTHNRIAMHHSQQCK